jgi:hypothetical protein
MSLSVGKKGKKGLKNLNALHRKTSPSPSHVVRLTNPKTVGMVVLGKAPTPKPFNTPSLLSQGVDILEDKTPGWNNSSVGPDTRAERTSSFSDAEFPAPAVAAAPMPAPAQPSVWSSNTKKPRDGSVEDRPRPSPRDQGGEDPRGTGFDAQVDQRGRDIRDVRREDRRYNDHRQGYARSGTNYRGDNDYERRGERNQFQPEENPMERLQEQARYRNERYRDSSRDYYNNESDPTKVRFKGFRKNSIQERSGTGEHVQRSYSQRRGGHGAPEDGDWLDNETDRGEGTEQTEAMRKLAALERRARKRAEHESQLQKEKERDEIERLRLLENVPVASEYEERSSSGKMLFNPTTGKMEQVVQTSPKAGKQSKNAGKARAQRGNAAKHMGSSFNATTLSKKKLEAGEIVAKQGQEVEEVRKVSKVLEQLQLRQKSRSHTAPTGEGRKTVLTKKGERVQNKKAEKVSLKKGRKSQHKGSGRAETEVSVGEGSADNKEKREGPTRRAAKKEKAVKSREQPPAQTEKATNAKQKKQQQQTKNPVEVDEVPAAENAAKKKRRKKRQQQREQKGAHDEGKGGQQSSNNRDGAVTDQVPAHLRKVWGDSESAGGTGARDGSQARSGSPNGFATWGSGATSPAQTSSSPSGSNQSVGGGFNAGVYFSDKSNTSSWGVNAGSTSPSWGMAGNNYTAGGGGDKAVAGSTSWDTNAMMVDQKDLEDWKFQREANKKKSRKKKQGGGDKREGGKKGRDFADDAHELFTGMDEVATGILSPQFSAMKPASTVAVGDDFDLKKDEGV